MVPIRMGIKHPCRVFHSPEASEYPSVARWCGPYSYMVEHIKHLLRDRGSLGFRSGLRYVTRHTANMTYPSLSPPSHTARAKRMGDSLQGFAHIFFRYFSVSNSSCGNCHSEIILNIFRGAAFFYQFHGHQQRGCKSVGLPFRILV